MKKIGLLILALVLAVGSLGVGYAMWSDAIEIQGTVDTATVCMEWSNFTLSDYCIGTEGDPPPDYPAVPPYRVPPYPGADPKYPVLNDRFWGKNVACTDITYWTDEYGNPDPKKLVITVYDAYPGYFADWQIEWKNCGTLPVRIQDIIIEPENFDIATTTNWTSWESDGEIYIDWVSDNIGDQLHQGDDGATSFKLLVMQTAEQGTTYRFTVTLKAVQWNEYTAP